MGGSGKWVKALVSFRRPARMDRHEKLGYQGKKWKLLRKSFGELGFRRKGLKTSHGSVSGRCDSADIAPLTAAVATLARDPPPHLWVVRQERAATRIQTAFRALLARWALKALKGVVRIQALVRGRQVRKQAAVTLRCMQALVRVQARIRASRVRRSSEGQAVQRILDQHRRNSDCLRQAEEGWCCGNGTLEDVKANMQMRQEGAIRRDRAAAYSLKQANQKLIMNKNPTFFHSLPQTQSKSRSFCLVSPSHGAEFDRGWSWLEQCAAAKRCAPSALKLDPELCPVSVRKNNLTTRILAKPPQISKFSLSSSSPSSEFFSGGSRLTAPAAVKINGKSRDCPNYMNSTKSSKGKLKSSSHLSRKVRGWSVDGLQI